MRILELGDHAFLKGIHPEQVDYFYVGKKTSRPTPFLTFSEFRRLQAKLRAGTYDVVVVSLFNADAPVWRRERPVLSNLLRILKGAARGFYSFGLGFVPWLLKETNVPLIVIDRKDDPDKIPSHLFPLLRRCHRYYWRECPVKLEHGFTFTTNYLEDTSAVRKSKIFLENRQKIRPLTLGVPWKPIYESLAKERHKTIDIFFGGTIKGLAVREHGMRLLKELEQEGLKVLAATDRFSEKDFLELCAQSWLVWSPEGHGWDCYRHYETCLAGSLPVMNYPGILRERPLIDQIHGFYYGVEDDDLKRVIKSALARDKDDLRRMSHAGREHVMKYHLEETIFPRVLTGLKPFQGRE